MLGIHRARGPFRMELHAQERPRAVPDSLVRPIIGIREPWLPSLRQRIWVNGEAVVLGSDETAPASCLETGLVVAAMAEFEFVRFRSRRERQQLVSETDSHDWAVQPHGSLDIPNGRITDLGISRSVRHQYHVEVLGKKVVVPR